MACLKVVSTPPENKDFPDCVQLRGNAATKIGRSAVSCDVCFPQAKIVSRLHLSIIHKAGEDGWFIRDENSRNGTYVNSCKLDKRKLFPLKYGDVVSFGEPWSTGGKLQYMFHVADTEEGDTDDEGADRSISDMETAPSGGSSSIVSEMFKQTMSENSCTSFAGIRQCVKRRRSANGDDCPFSSLMRMVRNHAKKLCLSGCKAKPDQVMAAASAACNAIVSQQTLGEKTESKTQKDASCIPGPCIPLLDHESESCIPLEKPTENMSHHIKEKTCTISEDQPCLVSKRFSELRTELTCSICQDPFLHTNTLECGHSFCEPCINSWLSKCLSCPICRDPVEKPPVKSRCLDKAVEVTLQNNNVTAWEALQQRKAEYEEKVEADLQTKARLEEALEKAIRKGLKCVHIGRPWSKGEQSRFLKGLKYYHGAPREAYCSSVCLTPTFVHRASLHNLTIAASNVQLGSKNNGEDESWNKLDAIQLRNRLCMFLRYG